MLTFRRAPEDDRPFHMLLDCGMKAGSGIADGPTMDGVLRDIHAATGGVLDVVVVTHEHEDHVSGFPKRGDEDHPFATFTVKELWLAWTEDPDDDDANDLRDSFGDQLLTLALAHDRLSHQSGVTHSADVIADFLESETGSRDGAEILKQAVDAPSDDAMENFGLALNARRKIRGFRYKTRLQYLRNMPGVRIKYLSPGDGPIPLPGVENVRLYPFGPPRDPHLLTRLNPFRREEFHTSPAFAAGSDGSALFAAFSGAVLKRHDSPFAPRFSIDEAQILEGKIDRNDLGEAYLARTYRTDGEQDRKIDDISADDAENLALRLNSEVNNTSLVLLFELMGSGQTLLFTGDAQAGSWRSWADLKWLVDGVSQTALDLLGRCTFYKVGHHGSHNATLNGTPQSDHPNLSWLARGPYAKHFTAMIPSNEVWASTVRPFPWRHPLKAIDRALRHKASGRIITLNGILPDGPRAAQEEATFDKFRQRCSPPEEKMFRQLWVPDSLDHG